LKFWFPEIFDIQIFILQKYILFNLFSKLFVCYD
jgi:hypothetical protein